MGTNYYLYRNVCPHCGRGDEYHHIGKSSAGWCFSVHVDPNEGVNSLGELQQKMQEANAVIKDEYGTQLNATEMLSIITERGPREVGDVPHGYPSWDVFHRENHSEIGPNGMLRHQIDGRHCVGHGDGTWDLITGEFS